MTDQPIAWGMPRPDGLILDVICPEEHAREPGQYTVPLYAAPQPKAEQVLGTKTWFDDGKLVTQNLTADDIYKAEQGPVAVQRWTWIFEDKYGDKYTSKGQVYTPDEAAESAKILGVKSVGPTGLPVISWETAATPPAPQPRRRLTDQEIDELFEDGLGFENARVIARAIEAAVWGEKT
jgi:hypothetical protein